MAEITVAVVDDHPIVREGLIEVIRGFGGFRVTGAGHTAADAVELARRDAPDILILDLGIPGSGIEAIRAITQARLRTRILVLTISERLEDVMDAMRLGAAGYALKGISGDELLQVMNRLVNGIGHITPHLAARILGAPGRMPAPQIQVEVDFGILSKREGEIYVLIRRGCCNKEIGRSLNLSEKTVKHYLTNIFRKLDVRNRTELAIHAYNMSGKAPPNPILSSGCLENTGQLNDLC